MARTQQQNDVELEPSVLPDALGYTFNDVGNAQYFVAMYGDLVRFDHACKRWLRWGLHRWEPDVDGAVRRMAVEALRQRREWIFDQLRQLPPPGEGGEDPFKEERAHLLKALRFTFNSENRNRLEAMIALASNLRPVADSGEGWDETPGLLCCENGVVDLHTGELRDGRPEDRITMQVPVLYDPEARCPRFRAALRDWLGTGDPAETEEVVRFVRRLLGYGITGEASLEMLLFLMGGGGNGKSTLLECYRAACGDYAMEVEATVLKRTKHDRHSTEVADLAGARMVTCEELGDEKLNTDRIKHLTGGTYVRARRVRENSIEFKQTWLLILTSNGQPKADDSSWGFWRRVVVLDFPNAFPKDENFKAGLMEELPGILTGIVRGAVEWYAEGLGEVPDSVAEHTREYRESVDPLEALFSGGVLVEEDGAFTSTETAYKAYQWWAHGVGQPYIFGIDGFAKALGGRPSLSRKQKRVDGRLARGFVGLAVGDRVTPEALDGVLDGASEAPTALSALVDSAVGS